MTSAKNGVRIRSFRKADSKHVQDLFMEAMAYGPGSPLRSALRDHISEPTSYLTYALALTGGAIAACAPRHKAFGAVLSISAAGWFFAYRRLLWNSFINYFDMSLKDDLADIATHYKIKPVHPGSDELEPSGPSGFWVIESDLPNNRGSEIVGCVGLDCQYKDGVIRGELRRMNVSPRHRRMGIAALLIETLIGHARKHHLQTVWLGTTGHQKPAISMYEKFGWVESSRQLIREGPVSLVMLEYRLDLAYPGTL
ncbi:N-acetylaspartate synthetase [Hypsizygus marmoreus]|uniref:N-acetylaspartate synthetase n=1 Tax=Hypsizygus marmoreus TaxID=39966 RepID=A0A369JBK2_HYPMA|nr:N-acetylaspartate synthetase [Hypsizygus marmoreus]